MLKVSQHFLNRNYLNIKHLNIKDLNIKYLNNISIYAQKRFNSTQSENEKIDSKNIMLHLANISEELGSSFTYPKVAVVGNQSSGKSSVLESIVGLPILPKGNDMVTRRPLELTLLRDQTMSSGFKAKFESAGRIITSVADIQQEILARNMGEVTSDPIYLTITSPNVHNLTVVDLPGFIRVTKAGQDEKLPDTIRDMCLKYINNPTYMKLIVMDATNDRALSMGLEEVKKAHQFHNAFGVLTKIDMIIKKQKSRNYLIEMLRDKDYLPGLGLIGVKLRSGEDIDDGLTLDDMIANEIQFIKEHRLDQEDGIRVGVPLLREVLSCEQLKRISSCFPSMIAQIEAKIITEQANRSLLDNLAAQPDLRPISGEVKKLVTSLHPLSPMRGDFESELEHNLGELVRDEIDRAITNNEPLDQPKDLSLELGKQQKNNSTDFEQSSFFNGVRDSYNKINGDGIDKGKHNDFRKLTILGESDPQIDENELHDITVATHAMNSSVPFYRWKFPKDFNRRRVVWNEQLGFVIEDVLEVNKLADKSRQYCIDQIIKFVEKEAERKNNTVDANTELAKGFFRYILNQIAERTDKENLVDSIKHMVAREKRPLADLTKMAYGSHRISKLPFNKRVGLFGEEHFPVYMNIYGNIWNHAYVNDVLIPRIQTDVFRIIAVNLLDPLILDTIEQSLKFFQQKDFNRDQKEVNNKINRMNDYIKILREASEVYQPIYNYAEQNEKHNQAKGKKRGKLFQVFDDIV